MEKEYQKRIGYEGAIAPVLVGICSAFGFGRYLSHKVLTFGYEDFNIVLTTSKGKFFVKIFSTFRNLDDCKRYINVLEEVLRAGVRHPKMYKARNSYLFQTTVNRTDLRLCVMEYIDGNNLFEIKGKLNGAEMKDIVHQAAKINSIKMKPSFVYDSWAITSFLKEFEKVGKFVEEEDLQLITPLVESFKNFPIETLPHCLVHGDIIKTNVMRSKSGKLYILDFAVANYYPRIQELAVLLCNMLFDEDNLDSFPSYYKLALTEYQKTLSLSTNEIETLPLFIKIAHAMHIIPATREKELNQNISEENLYWLNLGKIGLKYTTKLL